MHPGVDERDGFTADVFLRKLLGRELVNEVILLFLADEIKAVLKIRLNYLDSYLRSLLLVCLSFLFLMHAVVSEGPNTQFTQKWVDVFFHGLHEVGVVEAQNLLHEIAD